MNKITLGWLRVVLAFMVVDHHYGFFRKFFDHLSAFTGNTHKFYFCGDGAIAVSGFFIMSGYLVSEILHKKYPSNSYHDFLHFVTSRYLRIFPLYIFVLTFYVITMAVLVGHGYGLHEMILNAALLPYGILDYFSGLPLWNKFIIGAAWTLSLDLVFYPIGFLLIKQKRFLIFTFIILTAYYLGIWALSPNDPGTVNYDALSSWWRNGFYSTIEPNMLAFVLGIMANCHVKEAKKPSAWLCLSVLSLIYVCYFPLAIGYFGAQFIGMISLAYIVSFLGRNGMSKNESLLGSFTFAIYLIHQLTPSIIYTDYEHSGIVSLLISSVLAFVLAVYVEENFFESRRRSWLGSWRHNDKYVAYDFTKMNIFSTLLLFSSMVYYAYGYFFID